MTGKAEVRQEHTGFCSPRTKEGLQLWRLPLAEFRAAIFSALFADMPPALTRTWHIPGAP